MVAPAVNAALAQGRGADEAWIGQALGFPKVDEQMHARELHAVALDEVILSLFRGKLRAEVVSLVLARKFRDHPQWREAFRDAFPFQPADGL